MSSRLLVIDDSLTVRKAVGLSLKNIDAAIDYATTGHEGLLKATHHHGVPDVILLDFVLPDMRGIDVAQRLAQDARTANVPIILMTAKDENVRELFKGMRTTVDYVSKPFSPDDIVTRVQAILDKQKAIASTASLRPSRPPAPASVSLFSFRQKETAAKALFATLRPQFTRIPEWMAQLGANQPAPFFARKFLTPELVGQLLDALVPVFKEVIGGSGPAEPAEEGEGALSGKATGWSPMDILKMIRASGQTGELWLAQGSRKVIVYLRRGEIVLATSHDPLDYCRDARVPLPSLASEIRERAEADQRSSGKPFFVTLAERGYLPTADLASVLQRQGKRVLLDAVEASSVRFFWREKPTHPPYVDAYGMRISVAQLDLERLRRPSGRAGIDARLPKSDTVYERAENFSRRLREFELGPDERRILSLVGGANSVQTLTNRSGMPAREIAFICDRLAHVGLIAQKPQKATVLDKKPGAVMILEPDVEGFQKPLTQLLQNRAEPLNLVSFESDKDIFASIVKERPRMVILNADAAGDAAIRAVAQVRKAEELSHLAVVAVLDAPSREKLDELSAAGFDSVLTKPVTYVDLERLLVA
jgi:DNA-binding response OmpR family regulator